MADSPGLPDLPAAFRWTGVDSQPALRCTPLEALAPHLFTSRRLEVSAAAAVLGISDPWLWQLAQVHGNSVVVALGRAPNSRIEADALITNDPSVAIAVRAADCVPLLMADGKTGAVAAVHAGWRGTAARVATAALGTMVREFGTDPADVVAAIGPSIGPCCYEVGSELVDAFAASGHERHLIDRWFQARPARRGEPRAAAPRLRLDVPAANRDQLILAGVPEAQIHTAGLCTAMNLDVVTSYRVEKEKAARIGGVIRPA